MVVKSFKRFLNALMILLKKFLNHGTEKVPSDGTKTVPLMILLKKFLKDGTKKVRQ